jgi:hydrogenase maturation protease
VSDGGGRPLCLALGNDILGDDGVGFAAGRAVAARFGDRVEVVLTSEAGLALLEHLAGRRRALLLDSVETGRVPAGTVLAFGRDDFRRVLAPSPHYAGLPEVLALGERLGLEVPDDLRVLAMEVEDACTVREGLSPAVERALPELVERAAAILAGWTATA